MISAVQECPDLDILTKLKECLDFNNTGWLEKFVDLGGFEALRDLTLDRIRDSESSEEEENMAINVLECVLSLTSAAKGLEKMASDKDILLHLCAAISMDGAEVSKLLLDLLSRICISAADGQQAVLQGFLQEPHQLEDSVDG
eukprot:CAMPEP_0177621440 /NCGR_PEP_ID=MMETSP0419_2-20121207/27587_1 /TAXON_ID=582737 /ORGANISM="Tetraselmis sp., Strain GSL018" /LENGTH=142 /DNA_ID=CAMNT_0019121359 /DNA_START=551 /DNA_END=976 /DNA_ORIENTATION=+